MLQRPPTTERNTVQTTLIPTPPLQPFMKLAQANMELMSKYVWSPEVTSEAVRSMQSMFEQSQASFAKLAQSQGFIGLMQGLMKNYTEFLTDFGQSAYAMMSQGQAALIQQAEDTGTNVIAVTARAGRKAS